MEERIFKRKIYADFLSWKENKSNKYALLMKIALYTPSIIKSKRYGLLSFKHNYPMRNIINPESIVDTEDRNFVLSIGTHCDFIIYGNLDKRIKLIVEVDGNTHQDPVQQERDYRKNRLLSAYGLNLLRIKTTEVDVQEKIEAKLAAI